MGIRGTARRGTDRAGTDSEHELPLRGPFRLWQQSFVHALSWTEGERDRGQRHRRRVSLERSVANFVATRSDEYTRDHRRTRHGEWRVYPRPESNARDT